MTMSARRIAALIAVFAMIALACGQKPGVHEAAFGGSTGPVTTTGLDGTALDGTTLDGGVPADAGAVDTSGLGGTAGTTTGTTTTTTGGTTTGGGGGGGGGGGKGGGGKDGSTSSTATGTKTGVTDSKILIGLHAPVTGAAPVRSDTFATGGPLYWRKGDNGKPVKIFGREVELIFADDQYTPSTARSVCQRMAEVDKVFLLAGGAGTDQIKACADFSQSRGIPYLSAGVTEKGLDTLKVYFAMSMSYADQVPLLAQYINANKGEFGWNGDPARLVFIATDTANFDDAVAAWQTAFPQAKVIRPSKSARGQSYSDDVCLGPQKNFDIVFPLTAPTFFLELEGSAGCNPQYVGVGVSMGLDTVANIGCATATGSMDGARFFSPWYSFTDAQQRDKDFIAAGGIDDIQFGLWGIAKVMHQLLTKAGQNLSREGFIASTEKATKVFGGVFPELNFSPTNHFGSAQVHVLRADCSTRKFVTEKFFASGF